MKITDLVGKPKPAPGAVPEPPKQRRARGQAQNPQAPARALEASIDPTDGETSMLLDAAIRDLEPMRTEHWANQPLPHGCALPPDPQAARFLEALDVAMSVWPTWGGDNLLRYFELGRARFAAYYVHRASVQDVYAMNMRNGNPSVSADFAVWGASRADIERDDARIATGGEILPLPNPSTKTRFIHVEHPLPKST
jgi:hypothetical protein